MPYAALAILHVSINSITKPIIPHKYGIIRTAGDLGGASISIVSRLYVSALTKDT